MALDTEDIKLSTGLQDKMEERLVSAINGTAKGVRAKVESEVDRIDEMDKIRNGRITKNEDDIECLQDETRVVKFAKKHPGKVIIGAVIFVALVSLSASQLNVKRTVEKMLNIELIEPQ